MTSTIGAGTYALCLGAASMLDDPAAATVKKLPPRLLFRRALRLALLPALIAALGASYSGMPRQTSPPGRYLELGAMLAVTLAGAAFGGGVASCPAGSSASRSSPGSCRSPLVSW